MREPDPLSALGLHNEQEARQPCLPSAGNTAVAHLTEGKTEALCHSWPVIPRTQTLPTGLRRVPRGNSCFYNPGEGQALWGRWQGPSQSLIHPLLSGLTCWAWPWAQAGPAEPPAFCQLGAVYTEGGFVEGVNKRLSLLGGDSIDIFKGIPFATASTLENPQRHPGWQGEGRRW